jgi:hypothetical protein
MKFGALFLACLFAAIAGALGAAFLLRKPERALPDTPALLMQVKQTARLETIEATLYKKVDFAPDPKPTDTLWAGAAEWARFALHAPHGKAIVFAVAHLSIDLRSLGPESLRVEGKRVVIVLPKIDTQIELKPGDTEVIGSNLTSDETAELFALAKIAFERQVEADAGLRERARSSAREDLRGILGPLGFSDVTFADALPAARTTN